MKKIILLFIFFILSSNLFALSAIDNKEISEKGFNSKTISNFISNHYQIPQNANCLYIQEDKENEGNEVFSLFFIEINALCAGANENKNLVFKILKNGLEEVENLEKLAHSPFSELNQSALKTKIRFIFPIELLAFKIKPEKTIFANIMEKAEGIDLKTIIITKTKEKITEAFKNFGQSLALLHLYFMDPVSLPKHENINLHSNFKKYYKTYPHNDVHWGNVFFKAKKNLITFIDNESFAQSYPQTGSIAKDIFKAALSQIQKDCQEEKVTRTCAKVIDAAMVFLQSYIQNYPEKEQQNLFQYIQFVLLESERFAQNFWSKLPLSIFNYYKEKLLSLKSFAL